MSATIYIIVMDALHQVELALGGKAAIARLFGISPQNVYQWFSGERKIPRYNCIVLEQKTNVRCEALRPDLDWSLYRATARQQESPATTSHGG